MMRLQKYLALSGVASRRNAEKMIADGRVAVNGTVITEMGVQVDELHDKVTVDGNLCRLEEEKHYLAYNKPIGEVTTVTDPEGRATVMDCSATTRCAYIPWAVWTTTARASSS